MTRCLKVLREALSQRFNFEMVDSRFEDLVVLLSFNFFLAQNFLSTKPVNLQKRIFYGCESTGHCILEELLILPLLLLAHKRLDSLGLRAWLKFVH